MNASVLLKMLFTMGFFGVKKYGRAGIKQRGGVAFYYYYDDPSTNPLQYDELFIHPAFRYYLNIKEHRGILLEGSQEGSQEDSQNGIKEYEKLF